MNSHPQARLTLTGFPTSFEAPVEGEANSEALLKFGALEVTVSRELWTPGGSAGEVLASAVSVNAQLVKGVWIARTITMLSPDPGPLAGNRQVAAVLPAQFPRRPRSPGPGAAPVESPGASASSPFAALSKSSAPQSQRQTAKAGGPAPQRQESNRPARPAYPRGGQATQLGPEEFDDIPY